MKKFLITCLALVSTAWLTQTGWAESRYQGKPADHWIKLLGHAEAGQRLAAVLALGQIGPEKLEIVAAVTAAVADKDASVRQAAVVALGRVGTVEQLTALVNGKEPALRQAALQALGELAAKDENAVKVLVKALQGRNLREAAAVALGNMKTIYTWQAIEALSKAAFNKDEDGQFRLTAAEAAGKLITCRRTFRPSEVYQAVLKNQNPEIRLRALRLLCSDSQPNPDILIELLADQNSGVRQQAAAALRGTGAAAVPGLTKLLTHEQPETRREAAVLLGQLNAKSAVPALTEALNDKAEPVRFQAAVALWQVNQQTEPALPLLIAALQAKDLKAKNLDRRDEVLDLLRQMGPQAKAAIPVLVPMLVDAALKNPRSYDCNAIEDVLAACGKEAVPALLQALKHENPKVRGRIAQVFLEMEKTPLEAVPALIEAMKGMTERRELARALRAAGAAGVPQLLEALGHEDAGVRREVVVILGQVLPRNQAVPAALLQAAKDPDAEVRRSAIAILGTSFVPSKVQARDQSAIPVLVEALQDAEVRSAAANALGAFGPLAKETVPVLQSTSIAAVRGRCLPESAFAYQLAATRAIFHIQRDVAAVRPTLWGLTFHSAAGIVQDAEAALIELGPEAVPFLMAELGKDNPAAIRFRAASLLGRINLGSHDVTADLGKALRDQDQSVRLAAARALARLGEKAKDVAPLLGATLKDKNQLVRLAALEALQNIGAAAKVAIPELAAALKDAELCPTAVRILGRLGADAKDAAPALQALLNDKDQSLRVTAAEALWKINGEARDVAPALCLVLAENNQVAIQAAARVLAEIGVEAKSSIPFLVEALQHERIICRCRKTSQDEIRTLIVLALSNHGPEAVPYLVAALAHDKPQVRAGAFETLTRMGMQAREAVPTLVEALRDGDPSYRAAAASTLKAIDPAAADRAGVK